MEAAPRHAVAARASGPCGNIDPLGITGTPVYYDGNRLRRRRAHQRRAAHQLVALNLHSGAGRLPPRAGRRRRRPTRHAGARRADGRPGARVWVPFGGMAGDCGDYKGRRRRLPARPAAARRCPTPSRPRARPASGRRRASPPTPRGHLFVAVGNGASGVGGRYDHSDSVLKLSTDPEACSTRSPRPAGRRDNDADKDLGSQGPALVGPWIFQAGKSGTAYVLRQPHLGGIGGQVSSATLCRSFGGTAVAGSTVYVPVHRRHARGQHQQQRAHDVLWHASCVDHRLAGRRRRPASGRWTRTRGRLYALDPSTGQVRASIAVGHDEPLRHAGRSRAGTCSCRRSAGGRARVRTS